ncbi:MAG: metal ABC transporter permease [Moraxella sp.]|nr:metal ABC transporter permease [Moraxella sp.]
MSWFAIIAPAWLAGSLLVLLSAPLGCLVLWRRMAFFSDTLAHGALLGVAVAAWLGLPADIGMAMVSVLVVIILSLIKSDKLPSDAVLAVLASTLLCLGLLTLTQLTQQQANVLGFLFGNLLDIGWQDLPRLLGLVVIGLGVLASVWQAQIKIATNHTMAKIQGVSIRTQEIIFMGLLAGFCAIALQAVGSLLISGLLILPALSARIFARSPTHMVVLAVLIGEIAVSTGVWGSIWLDTQTGLTVVLVLAVIFFTSFALNKIRKQS